MTEAGNPPDGQDQTQKPNDPAALDAKNKELLAKLSKATAELNTLRESASKAAELEPIKAKYDKLAAIAKELGVDPDKADPEKERQRIADAQRQREEEAARRERAITRSLVGSLPAGTSELVVEFALDRLMKDKTIVYNQETNAFDGLAEARRVLLSDPLFAGAVPALQGSTPPPPRLPRSGGADGGSQEKKFDSITSLLQLQAIPVADQMEFATKYPERYEALRLENRAQLARPLPTAPPPMGQPYQPPTMAAKR